MINVPLAGPVSFSGFMLLGPVVLIMLRVYSQIYVEHSNRLERLGRAMSAARAPTLMPLKNPLMRVFSGLTFYLVLPIAMILFALKAAAFPAWGSGLLSVAVGVIASHAILPLGEVSWRSKALLSVSAAIIAVWVLYSFGPLRRPFALYHADLSKRWLEKDYFSGADLRQANLIGSHLSGANLSHADLSHADLSHADLSHADLSHAHLIGTHLSGANLLWANLSGADLHWADLSGTTFPDTNLSDADLRGANLSDADLTQAKLSGARLSDTKLEDPDREYASIFEACRNAATRLPEGVTVKPCRLGR